MAREYVALCFEQGSPSVNSSLDGMRGSAQKLELKNKESKPAVAADSIKPGSSPNRR